MFQNQILCLVFASLTCFVGTISCHSKKPEIVARVGRYEISARDVEQRDQVAKIYFPEIKEKYGLKQLIDGYTAAVIAHENGRVITPDMIAAEEARIQKETQAPAKLKQIEAIFGKDRDAYRRVYVMPIYAERIIYEMSSRKDFATWIEQQKKNVAIWVK